MKKEVLAGQVALVTGGTKGLGAAIAQLFAEHGAIVYVAGRALADAQASAKAIGPTVHGLALDVGNRAAWQAAIEAIDKASGRLDILVNNAGISVGGTIENTTDENWRSHMAINLDGVFYGCQTALPLMKRSGQPGSIVNISSVITERPGSGLMAYAASKAAMTTLTKSVALHCAAQRYPIRANTIHPGGIETPLLEATLNNAGVPREQAYERWSKSHPMGRFGLPQEVAQAALWLASSASSFTTGAEIAVDGGAAIKS
jgi:NAD(P)-dependent dehydrogenase (short-subunit alcohol dehydrogenase family)